MPVYEYACAACRHRFDVRHGADEKPALCCPQCAGEVKKVFHAAGIIFKGSGWYVTDNALKKGGNGKDEAPSATKDDGKDKVLSETKNDGKDNKPEVKTPAPATAEKGG